MANKRSDRSVPMQILNLSMMRTGTMCKCISEQLAPAKSPMLSTWWMLITGSAIKQALEILDIPCWHGVTAFSRISDCPEWQAALEAKFFHKGTPFSRERWDHLLGEFGAVSDVPAIALAEDLISAYPEAKVILVERDHDRWHSSFNEAVVGPVWNPVLQLIARYNDGKKSPDYISCSFS
ncbi:MAG: hypothetical protein M1820_001852 [Bogoriella megaspora]|nr:MAG: hypothetical protein M1820_001852 [Bogoriella megaspora]